jgi:DNA adenine methylase
VRYIGGKARTASRIADVIIGSGVERHTYIEPFLGAASVACEMVPWYERSVPSDAHPDVVELWRDVVDGWVPPCHLSHDRYDELRSSSEPSALRAWAGFAASYNGKWFGGYGPVAESAGRDYLAEAQRATLCKRRNLTGATIRHSDYLDIVPEPKATVYCDPPYADAMSYAGTSFKFDVDQFWSTMALWVDNGARVFVSEFDAPKGWESIWSTERQATVHHAYSTTPRPEHLWTRD